MFDFLFGLRLSGNTGFKNVSFMNKIQADLLIVRRQKVKLQI